MMELRASAERGHADHGWLQSAHSFSFADYFDPANMGFGNLRVINEDYIRQGGGFGMHSHQNMEIVTYVLQGALAHKDSMGNGEQILPGDVQRMSAGRGVAHSEINAASGTTHMLQIWILPNQVGINPSYEQKRFEAHEKRGKLRLIVSPDGREGSLRIHADASIYAGLINGDERAELSLDPTRRYYVHVALGALQANGQPLRKGDALKLHGQMQLALSAGENADVLVFELT